MTKSNKIISYFIPLILVIAMTLCPSVSVKAFDISSYAENSILSEGKWVKISVETTGMHLITDAQLREWGFTEPSKVKVYGYGGQRISDALYIHNYTDDLPLAPQKKISRGIAFYAQGPVKWSKANNSYSPAQNPFSTKGYYYLSDRDNDTTSLKPLARGTSTSTPRTHFDDRLFHEIDEYSPGNTGHTLYGEDFRYTPSRTFNFELTDFTGDTTVQTITTFFAKTHSANSKLTFTVNGTKLESSQSDEIRSISPDDHNFGAEAQIPKSFKLKDSKLSLGLTHSSSASILDARLNYIAITYPRHLRLQNGYLRFSLIKPSFIIEGATTDTHVWDVTKPSNALELPTEASGKGVSVINQYGGAREYVAWNENATLPSPKLVGKIANQNLHAEETPDMVIFTIKEWEDQAQRIADYHIKADNMKVLVVDQEAVFNEFSSGVPDPNGFRRLLKMFWDRGQASGTPLRYALFMGRQHFDNRRLTVDSRTMTYKTMPSWQSDICTDDNSSFTTDDIYAFLEDGSGVAMGNDRINIAVGRIPVRSVSNAKAVVDKLFRYINSMPKGEWKNHIMTVADDQDQGIHLEQSESLIQYLQANKRGSDFFYDKVYIDAYTKFDGTYPAAREKMFRLLNEGTMWWNYIGHANTTGWTHEKILTIEDMSNLFLRRYPILYAATCDFFRWDASSLCGAEVMFNLENGGIIAGISATRPVWIAENGYLSEALGRQLLQTDKDGNFRTLGEIYMAMKNNIINKEGETMPSTNRLRYVLMGDPAMPLSLPNNSIKIHTINGKAINPDNPPQIMACQEISIEGAVYDPLGKTIISDFNGTIQTTLFDAEKSVTTLGNGGDNGKEITYEEQGSRLLTSNGKIENGIFSIKIIMPSEIANNYRLAALNLAAYSDGENSKEAFGCERNIYVYGRDENADIDTIAPVIESMVLNHSSFQNGDHVNDSPMLLARISDNRAINLSTAGIGRQMMIYIDGTKGYTDVPNYFTPTDAQRQGDIAYPISGLMPGEHTLRLRVWDSSGNYAESEIVFNVDEAIAPTIMDIYSDANPASIETNFYVSHDRPDAMATITVTVYNMLGAEVWSSTVQGKSDMYQSFPIKWDLRDNAGHRVNRGIYLYRATMTTDGKEFSSKTKRIAVTGQ